MTTEDTANPLALGRRAALAGLAAVPFTGGFAGNRVLAAAPPAATITDKLVADAKKDGTVVWHSSIELSVCQRIAEGFNKRYPDVKVQLERSGAERILQRIEQEYASNVNAADVVESSDIGTFINWKKQGWLAPFVPKEVAEAWPVEERDADGAFATFRASLSTIAYNTRLVKPEDAPKTYADLLNPRWRMRMVKAHPGYSGSILTATFALSKALGWDWFDKLSKQRVMQVQSATEPPKKVVQGERLVMADGSEYVALNMKDAGDPITCVYPPEGTPILSGPTAVMSRAPHPNAARLFALFLFTNECQQIITDAGNLRSVNPAVPAKAGHAQLKDIKLLRSDPLELAAAGPDLKKKYADTFGV